MQATQSTKQPQQITASHKASSSSSIAALKAVSLSEIATVDSKYTEAYAEANPDEILKLLFDLGIDTKQKYEHQLKTHRNMFNNVITCSRWVGEERTDYEWINSGYASTEAIDRSKNNRLLNDLYWSKDLSFNRANGVWEPEDDELEAARQALFDAEQNKEGMKDGVN